MYVTVGEERNQTWNPREKPLKGWLFRMFLNHIGSRGGVLWWNGVLGPDGHLCKRWPIQICSVPVWFRYTIADTDIASDTRAHFISILSLFLLVLCLRFHHAAEINHTALKKKIHKFTEFKCIPKECIYVRLHIQTGSSNSCNVLIQFKYLIRKTVEK